MEHDTGDYISCDQTLPWPYLLSLPFQRPIQHGKRAQDLRGIVRRWRTQRSSTPVTAPFVNQQPDRRGAGFVDEEVVTGENVE